jgi:hypothetical protein
MMAHKESIVHMSDAGQLEAALREALARNSACNWYALLDGSQLPDLMHSLRRGALRASRYVSLFDERSETGAGDAAPFLVDLKSAANLDRAIAYTVRNALTSYAVSWIASSLDMRTLAARLAQRLDARLTENMDVLLRYYDSRILSSLSATLIAEQSCNFFNFSQQWWYATRGGGLHSCVCNFANEDQFIPPLSFSQAHENQLTELAFPDAVLEHLLDEQGDLLASMNRAEQHAFVARQIECTKELRLESMADIVTYCVIALVVGEDFSTRMPWQEKVAAIKAGKVSFKELDL